MCIPFFTLECARHRSTNRKVANDVTQLAPKKWLTKSCNLCWKDIGQTPTIGVVLKTNQKITKIRNELLLVGFSETNELIKSDLFEIRSFSWLI